MEEPSQLSPEEFAKLGAFRDKIALLKQEEAAGHAQTGSESVHLREVNTKELTYEDCIIYEKFLSGELVKDELTAYGDTLPEGSRTLFAEYIDNLFLTREIRQRVDQQRYPQTDINNESEK